MAAGTINNTTTAMVLYSENNETVEWINMCWRKVRYTGCRGYLPGNSMHS